MAEVCGAVEVGGSVGRIHGAEKVSGQHTMAAIADHFGVHYATVTGLVKAYEVERRGRCENERTYPDCGCEIWKPC